MCTVGIIGNGPRHLIPDLTLYAEKIDIWIGADRGALTLIEHKLSVDIAMGDFDSTTVEETDYIKQHANEFMQYPIEKDKTDIEIALLQAFTYKPSQIFLFGVTGGRLDHELINIQLLYQIMSSGIRGIIVDQQNELELILPGKHTIEKSEIYPNISFIPYTQRVEGITLTNFYYPLTNENITWGSTLCISNKLLEKNGTISYDEGILLVVKSRDAGSHPIQK